MAAAGSTKQVPKTRNLEWVAGDPFGVTITWTGATVTEPIVTLKTAGRDPYTTDPGVPLYAQVSDVTSILWGVAASTALGADSKLPKVYKYTIGIKINGDGPHQMIAGDISILPLGSSSASTSDDTSWSGDITVGGVDITFNMTVGASSATDLTWTPSPTGATIVSSTGADATVTAADGTNAGLLLPADFTKLAGIATGAQVNDTAAQILAKLVTVDGAASGLDADTLDGISSSGFVQVGAAAGGVLSGTYPSPGFATDLATQAELDAAVASEITARNSAISAAINALIAAAPGTLDTLNELAVALGNDPSFAATITTALAGKQAIDTDLTAIAALVSAANKMPYATGVGTWALADLTAFARTFLDDANAAAVLSTLGTGTAALVNTGTGASNAILGNDARLTDSRAPTGAAGGVLTGTYPNPTLATDPGPMTTTRALARTTVFCECLSPVSGNGEGGLTYGLTGGTVGEGGGELSHPGVVALGTSTSATGRANVATQLATILLGGGIAIAEALIKIPTLSTGSERFNLRVGFIDRIDQDSIDGCYFEYDDSVGANWLMCTAAASSRTKTASSTAVPAATWTRLRVVVNAAASSVEFFVDGVSIGTVSTNLPTATTGLGVLIIKSIGTTARSVSVDYVFSDIVFTTSR